MTTNSETTSDRLNAVIKSARSIMRKDKGLNGDLDRLPILTWLMFLKFLDDLEKERELESELSGEAFRPLIESPYRWRDWANRSNPTGDELLRFINADETPDPFGVEGDDEIPGLFAYLRSLPDRSDDVDRSTVVATVFRGVDNRMKSGYLLREVVSQVNQIQFGSSEHLHTLGSLYEGLLKEMRDAAGDSGEFYTPRPLVRLMVQLIDPQLGERVMDPASGTGGFLVEAFNHLQSQVETVEDHAVLQGASVVGTEPKPLPYLLCQMNLILHGMERPVIDNGNSLRFRLNEIGDADRVDVILTNPPFGGEEERGIQGNFPPDMQTAETALLFLQLIMRKLKRGTTAVGRPARAAVVVPNNTLYASGVAETIRKMLCEQFRLQCVLRLPKGVFEPYTDIASNVIFFESGDPDGGVWIYDHPLPEHRAHLKSRAYSASDGLKYEEFEPFMEWWRSPSATDQAFWVTKDELDATGFDLAIPNPNAPELEFPALSKQVESLTGHLRRLEKSLGQIAEAAAAKTTRSGRRLALGEVWGHRENTLIEILDTEEYMRLRVQLHFRGVLLRDRVMGSAIGTRRQNQVRSGDLVMSRIDARNGAMGLVPDELDGAIVTNDFPSFAVATDLVHPVYLRFCLFSPDMLEKYERLSRGSTNRRRIIVEKFLELEIPMPTSLEEQIEIAETLMGIERSTNALASDLEELSGAAELLVPSALHSLLADADS